MDEKVRKSQWCREWERILAMQVLAFVPITSALNHFSTCHTERCSRPVVVRDDKPNTAGTESEWIHGCVGHGSSAYTRSPLAYWLILR